MAGRQSKFIVRNRHFLLFDLAIFVFSAAASFYIRLETPELRQLIWGGLLLLCAAVPVRLYVFLVSGMYKSYWRNAGPSELLLIVAACGISGAVITTIIFAMSLLWPQSQAIVP